MKMLWDTLRDEEGSALAEFSIVTPAVLMLLFYSIFFTDLVEVKLKTLEAARYAAWEKTVHRRPDTIAQEVQERFANLNSTDLQAANTTHMIGVTNVQVTASVDDQLDIEMAGVAPQGAPGFIESVLGAVDTGVDTFLGWMDLPSVGKARSEVSIQVENLIVPQRVANLIVAADELSNPFVFKAHHAVAYDTWRAWPNPNLPSSDGNTNTPPSQTYPVAERIVAKQLDSIAFTKFIPGVGDVLDFVGDLLEFLNFFGLPNPIDNDSSRDDYGPITMRPVETVKVASWSPSYGTNDATRLGHRYGNSKFTINSPDPGIDRSRYSLPYRPTSEQWYQKDGGYKLKPLKKGQRENEYYKTYQCRGHYYMGMVTTRPNRNTDVGTPGHYKNYGPKCGDKVDAVQDKLNDLLGGFLPAF